MIRLLRTLLLGLLKLVLQLVILAVTGRWVPLGRREPKVATKRGRRRERTRPAGATRDAGGKRPIFERRQLGDRSSPPRDRWGDAEPPTLEELFLEEEGTSSWEHSQPVTPKRRGRKQPSAVPPPTRTSLARALRDPRAIRRAIFVGSIVAPRRR